MLSSGREGLKAVVKAVQLRGALWEIAFGEPLACLSLPSETATIHTAGLPSCLLANMG